MKKENQHTYTLQIKLDKTRLSIPGSYDFPPTDPIFVRIDVGKTTYTSIKKEYSDQINFSDFFNISFPSYETSFYASAYVHHGGSMPDTLIGKFEVVLFGKNRRFPLIKGIPCLVDQVLDGSKNNLGTLSLWVTAKDFGEKPKKEKKRGSKIVHTYKDEDKNKKARGLKISRDRVMTLFKNLGKKRKSQKEKKKKDKKKKSKNINDEETEQFVKMFAKANLFYSEKDKKENDEENDTEDFDESGDESNRYSSKSMDLVMGSSPEKQKSFSLPIKIQSVSFDSSTDFDDLPKIHASDLLNIDDTTYVHEVPCVYTQKAPAGIYTGEVSTFRTMDDKKYLLPNGYGTMKYEKIQYEGYFVKGLRHGKGNVISFSNPDAYLDCKWEYDNCTGICKFHDEENNWYEGSIKVVLKSKDIIKFDMSWFIKQGAGSFFHFDEGWVYSGDFINDQRSGSGIIDMKDGDRYIGKWKNGQFDGKGCYVYLDGSYFFGEFKNGQKIGEGEYYLSNGYKISGSWTEKKKTSGSFKKVNKKKDQQLMHDCSIELKGVINDEVRLMVEREIQRQKKKFNTEDANLRRSKFLWKSIFIREGLKSQIQKMNVDMGEFYIGFNENVCYQLLEDKMENGYLHSTLSLFINYFKSFYTNYNGMTEYLAKGESSSKRNSTNFICGEKRILLYAKDDVKTFIEYISSELIETMKMFKPDITLNNETNAENFVSLTKDELEKIGKNLEKTTKLCISDYVLREIFDVLDRMYIENYKEEEAIFKQKITSIFHALGSLPEEKKIKIWRESLEEMSKDTHINEFEKYQIEGVKSLLQSIDVKNEEKKVHELNYIKMFGKSCELLFKIISKHLEEEKINLDSFIFFFSFIKSRFIDLINLNEEKNQLFEKNNLLSFDRLLKLIRIGLICSFELRNVKKIEGVVVEFNKIAEKKFTEFNRSYLESIENQIHSSKCLFLQIQKSIIKSLKKDESNSVSINLTSVSQALDSVIDGVKCIGKPIYLQMNSLRNTVVKRIESLITFLSTQEISEDIKEKTIALLEKSKVGGIELVKKNYQEILGLFFSIRQNLDKDSYFVVKCRFDSCNESVLFNHNFQEINELISNFKIQLKSICTEVEIMVKESEKDEIMCLFLKSLNGILKGVDIDLNDSDHLTKKMILKRLLSAKNLIEFFESLKSGDVDTTFYFNLLQESQNIEKYNLAYSRIFLLPYIKKIISQEKIITKSIKRNSVIVANISSNHISQNMEKFGLENLKLESKEDDINYSTFFEDFKRSVSILKNNVDIFLTKKEREENKIEKEKREKEKKPPLHPDIQNNKKELQVEESKIEKKEYYKEIEFAFLNSIKCLENGVKTISTALECNQLENSFSGLNLIFSVTKEFQKSTIDKLSKLSQTHKIRTIEIAFRSFERMRRGETKKVKHLSLESFGVESQFIPKNYIKSNVIPYSESIEILKELTNKKTLREKFDVLARFEKSLHSEMCKIACKKTMKVFEEDDILPLTLYCFLRSDLNHHAQYNFLKDWKYKDSGMLMRYDVFLKYIQHLDPYLRSGQGELLNVIGNIVNPMKINLSKLIRNREKDSKNFSIRWLINLLNLIYCEIGFLKGSKILEIQNDSLEKAIKDRMEDVKFVLVDNVGFSVNSLPENDHKLVIAFKSIYSPNIYKYISSEILKEFKEFM